MPAGVIIGLLSRLAGLVSHGAGRVCGGAVGRRLRLRTERQACGTNCDNSNELISHNLPFLLLLLVINDTDLRRHCQSLGFASPFSYRDNTVFQQKERRKTSKGDPK